MPSISAYEFNQIVPANHISRQRADVQCLSMAVAANLQIYFSNIDKNKIKASNEPFDCLLDFISTDARFMVTYTGDIWKLVVLEKSTGELVELAADPNVKVLVRKLQAIVS